MAHPGLGRGQFRSTLGPANVPIEVRIAVSNGIPVPDFDLPVRDNFIDIQIFVALALSEIG